MKHDSAFACSVADLLRTDKKFAEAYLNIALDDVGMVE
jgi:hypothetical protein